MSGENEYEVGYKKPPVATRFRKGQSGNPTGKSKKKIVRELNPGKILELIDNEEIFVPIDGKPKLMKKGEIYFRQLFTKAIKGDLPAARLIASAAAAYFRPEAEGPGETVFVVVRDKVSRSRQESD